MKKVLLLLLLSSKLMAQQPSKVIDINDFMLIERVEDQEKQYNEMLKAHKGKSLPDSLTNDLRGELAFAWLANGNVERYQHYKSTSPKFTARQFLYLCNALEKMFDEKKDYRCVEKISAALLQELKAGTLTDDLGRLPVIMELNAAANARLGNIDRAKDMLKAINETVEVGSREVPYFKDHKSNFINRSAIVMLSCGQFQEAFDLLSNAYKHADSNPYMDITFKEIFQKVKGTDQGFENYLKGLKDEAYHHYYKEVEKLYIANARLPFEATIPDPDDANEKVTLFKADKPVRDIVLNDLAKRPVALGDYKGKVLVIDFWTTLCTPCVAAFGGFEKVVADYSKNQMQLFVINLFESDRTVKAYVAQKGIKLDVLHDEENQAYDIQGTPTKMVFDTDGNLRFYSAGYAGSTDREYYKLKAMVEITKSGLSTSSKSFGG